YPIMKDLEKENFLDMGEDEEAYPFGIETDEKTYRYQCLECGFEEDVPRFIIDEFIEDDFFASGCDIENFEVKMPILICPKCNGELVSKNTDE
ncbi:hypothetical protein, partial [Tepidibacter formicigenes]